MLVMYKGWGYFDYELDTDAMNKCSTKKWIKGERHSQKVQCVEPCYFELPKFAEKEVEIEGETKVDYLFLSKHSYLDDMELIFPYSEKEDIRFYLCEDEPIFDGWSNKHVQKTIKITKSDIREACLIDC
jgi:hypothetical protein